MTKADIEQIRQAVRKLFGDEPDVVAVYLFGSVASGRGRSASDIDLAVLLRPDFDYLEKYDYVLAASSNLEDALGRPVDVIGLNTADPVVQYEVRKNHVLLLERDRRARVAWEVRSRKLWFDSRPAHELYMRKMAKRLLAEVTGGGPGGRE